VHHNHVVNPHLVPVVARVVVPAGLVEHVLVRHRVECSRNSGNVRRT